MLSGKWASSSSQSNDSATSTKSKGSDICTALLGNAEQVCKSLEVLHVGKRLLLKAAAIYGKNIPRSEEKYNFQYIVKSIDSNNTTTTMEFERKYIEDHGTSFKVYPIIEDSDYCSGFRCVRRRGDWGHGRVLAVLHPAAQLFSFD
jgi:hypothetical protein